MVDSNVEYIEKDVAAADTEEEEESNLAWQLYALLLLAIPLTSTVFIFLFLNNVVGEIRIENLYYPLVVTGVLLLLFASVYISEIRKIFKYRRESSKDLEVSLREIWAEWNKSFGFLAVAIIYLLILPYLGFFIASVLVMIPLMIIGGYRNPLYIGVTVFLVLALIYVLFVEIANLTPPEGMFGF